jgi:hypothetical protein
MAERERDELSYPETSEMVTGKPGSGVSRPSDDGALTEQT